MQFRRFAKSLIALVVVAGSSYLLEVCLHRDGVPSRDLILLSNLLIGLIAGTLVYVLSVRERQRQEYVECRLRVIADMNHHIRNALQVISFHTRKGEKQEVGIREAVERIQWALREVLPQLPESMPAARTGKRTQRPDSRRDAPKPHGSEVRTPDTNRVFEIR